jgi:hypothetical protein
MERYFLNIYDGSATHDVVGTEFRSLREVRLHMVTAARDVLSKGTSEREDWRIEVLDTAGTIVCSMHFGVRP